MKRKGEDIPKKQGGMVTMPFIFANEICEKLAVVAFGVNMISYLTGQLHLPLTKAANTLTNFGGTSALTPLLGTFIADAFAGRFWTITIASIIYQTGMITLTLSAVVSNLRPPPCKKEQICNEAYSAQLAILYVSLLLTALGSGGIRPCVVSFGADQFDENDPEQKTTTWKFFNWYFFGMGASILLAITVIVYVQDYYIGWGWGFGIPTVAMAVSIFVFVFGYQMYRKVDPSGSPFTRLLQVCVAAWKKRKVVPVSDPQMLYENEKLYAPISLGGRLVNTQTIKFLDKGAVISEDDTESPTFWKLSTVHRVEELKSLVRMGPIWASGILVITASAQQGTFSLQQAKSMDRHLTQTFETPAASMSVFTQTSMLFTIIFYDRVLVPVMRKFTGLVRGISFLTRMGIGLVISLLATFFAGFLEIKRKKAAFEYGLIDKPHETIPISVFWLMPQYCLHGVAEAFMSIGHLEFLYDQSPESMRSTATALYWLSISFGSYGSTLLISLVHKYSEGSDGSNWLPDNNLNRGKLEYLYWLITLMQLINLVYYLFCAKFYTRKPLHAHKGDDDSERKDEV